MFPQQLSDSDRLFNDIKRLNKEERNEFFKSICLLAMSKTFSTKPQQKGEIPVYTAV